MSRYALGCAGHRAFSGLISNTHRSFLQNVFPSSRTFSSFGLLVDIDGVIIRGSKTIGAAVDAFEKISDETGMLKHPVVFLTNGSARSEQHKATSLSKMLNVNISGDQIVLVNSPLRDFTSWHDKNVFFAGQGTQLKALATDLGFKKPVVLSDVLRDMPMFDVVDHTKIYSSNRKDRLKSGSLPDTLPDYMPIDRIIVANTPVNWEAHIQLLLDLLLTGGRLRTPSNTQIPLLACNPDLVWAAEYHMPRLANGAFVHMLAAVYREMSGKALDITWCGKPTPVTYTYALNKLQQQVATLGLGEVDTVYGIGDNVDVDVVGANDNNVQSVLVCSGLYSNENIILEENMEVPSKRASVEEPISCRYVARDIAVFIDHILKQ